MNKEAVLQIGRAAFLILTGITPERVGWRSQSCGLVHYKSVDKTGAREQSVVQKHSDCCDRESGQSYGFFATISV